MLTSSMMPPLNTIAYNFQLKDTNEKTVSLSDFGLTPALLIAFISTHCPYTKHIMDNFIAMAREYAAKGLVVIAINSNDPAQHEEDQPEKMALIAKQMDFPFPYLIDDSQEVAKAYQAACTPDFFLYDNNLRLVYRGRYDDSRPENDVPVTGDQLRAAIDAVLAGKAPSKTQKPSVGCNIKWKHGNEPDYFAKQQHKKSA
jgi:peroxiredoxin